MRTLAGRLILSHLLPLLIVVTLIGLALDYVLETQFLPTNLASELTSEAVLLASLTADRPDIWTDSAQAQSFIDQIDLSLAVQVTLIDGNGRPLAATHPQIENQLAASPADLQKILSGEVLVHTIPGQGLRSDTINVLVPARNLDGEIIGAARLTQSIGNIFDRVLYLRYLIGIVLFIGLILGGVSAWWLGRGLGNSLQQVTQAVYQISHRQHLEPLPERGPVEIRLLLQSVNRLVSSLEELEKYRRQLLANLVHELSNPLGALHSATNALLGGAVADTSLREELLRGMQSEEIRLVRLLADLAGLNDQITGNLELRIAPVNLNQLLRQVLSPWREAARQKQLTWQETIPAHLPILQADQDRLAQAIGNLMSNAIKYTPKNGRISITAGRNSGSVWLKVEDSGPGIAVAEQARVFEPFYRGAANRRFADGMGLGLSIAHELVTAHNGRLTLTSVPGQGSQFTIWLPYSESGRL